MVIKYKCDFCGYNEEECFMLTDELWLKINGKKDGHLCLECIKERLSRNLKLEDFKNDLPLNESFCKVYQKLKYGRLLTNEEILKGMKGFGIKVKEE